MFVLVYLKNSNIRNSIKLSLPVSHGCAGGANYIAASPAKTTGTYRQLTSVFVSSKERAQYITSFALLNSKYVRQSVTLYKMRLTSCTIHFTRLVGYDRE